VKADLSKIGKEFQKEINNGSKQFSGLDKAAVLNIRRWKICVKTN
jgi:hypothetical protein